jgi:hypothetical protein
MRFGDRYSDAGGWRCRAPFGTLDAGAGDTAPLPSICRAKVIAQAAENRAYSPRAYGNVG